MGDKLTNYFVFGYGSLMYPWGINGRRMIHNYEWVDLQTATLSNFERGMFAGFDRYSFYGIIPNGNHNMNGVVFKIDTKRDLHNFLMSEGAAQEQKGWFPGGKLTYNLKDVTHRISDVRLPRGATVYTLVCDRDESAGRPVRPGYRRNVWRGIEHWGSDFRREFLLTGGLQPVKKKSIKKTRRKVT